ncbi:hypothetical protein C0Q70_10799 [Pomacea canaliculata]|uniref:Uncharacterized protein n=1 Tax=Pomacea canaliculata TaxID=400727 RepID=A0A2T7P460_POMCA|nr:hypothetical protein C0Q70_10799 [Pomacea canaliculata]
MSRDGVEVDCGVVELRKPRVSRHWGESKTHRKCGETQIARSQRSQALDQLTGHQQNLRTPRVLSTTTTNVTTLYIKSGSHDISHHGNGRDYYYPHTHRQVRTHSITDSPNTKEREERRTVADRTDDTLVDNTILSGLALSSSSTSAVTSISPSD